MNTPSIFLFEDEVDVNSLLSHSLEREGFKVYSALTCEEAEKIIQDFKLIDPPSLALLDIKQNIKEGIPEGVNPDKVGFHLAQLIRNSRLPIPIIFLTAYPDEFERESRRFENYDFLTKGHGEDIFSETLKQKIDKAIGDQRIRDWSRLPPGKICIKENRIMHLYDIEDILFFEGEGGQLTKIYLSSSPKPHSLTMNPGFFNEQLEQILQAHMKPSPFVEVYKGKYARLDKIVAFSNDMAYFDHAASLGVKINLATQTRLQEKYPPVLMY